MKKIFSLVLVLGFLLCIFSGCNNAKDESAKELYKQFIRNEICAVDKNGDEKPIDEYLEFDVSQNSYTYTYIDMTGDGVDELCVRQYPYHWFFTLKNGKVYHWYTENKAYVKLLNNSALLYERHGAAPTHINYEYYELDDNAEVEFYITFSWWDGTTVEEGKIYADTYFFDDKEVSKEEYEKKTKEYLSIGNDKIIWYSEYDNYDIPSIWGTIPNSFRFSSGVGAWATEITISPDGNFVGEYHDSNMGETGNEYPNGVEYYCKFSGKFAPTQKISEYIYFTELESLTVETTTGETAYEDGVKYIYTEPYGFDNADELYIYLPGALISDIEEGFLSWSQIDLRDSEVLPENFYGIYNISGEQGFVSYLP